MLLSQSLSLVFLLFLSHCIIQLAAIVLPTESAGFEASHGECQTRSTEGSLFLIVERDQ